MKFGDSLWRRSVPQWASYNVDYADIKHLIREQTTPGKGKAVSIPGHTEQHAVEFEHHLYSIFESQHLRLNQFVKSKIYEINSRLVWIGRQIGKLTNPGPRSLPSRSPANDLTRKCSTLETELLKTGQEIQDVSRFISVQRLALRKLLKKYKKWSGSGLLELKVEEQLLKQPDSFSQQTLEAVLSKYSAYYHVLRDLLNQRPNFPPFDASLRYETGVEFDTVLDQCYLNSKAETAIYWVHSDNVIELRVALLQYFNQLTFDAPVAKTSPSSHDNPINISSDDRAGVVICDSLKRYTVAQGDLTFSNRRDRNSEPYVRARWTRNGEAAVCIPATASATAPFSKSTTFKLPRRKIARFLDSTPSLTTEHSDSESSDQENQKPAQDKENYDFAQHWLSQRSGIQPLASIRFKRTRYVGLSGLPDKSLKAVLDNDIMMTAVSLDELKSDKYFDSVAKGVQFPHAVLSICSEHEPTDIIRLLDESHLTERINNFSIEVHAIATCFNPPSLRVPYWMSALSKDIRHIPDSRSPLQRSGASLASSGTKSPSKATNSDRSMSTDLPASSTRPTSKSTNSSPENMESESRKIDKRKLAAMHHRASDSLGAHASLPQQAPQIYWSEYDHPEPGEGTDEYMIYVDPNTEDFPGQKALMSLFRRSRKFVNGKILTRPKKSHTYASFSSSSSADDDDASSSDEEAALIVAKSNPYQTARHRETSYGTLLQMRDPIDASAKETITFVGLALFAATVVLSLSAILATTGRKRQAAEVDAGILVGSIASLALAVSAVTALLMLRSRLALAGVALHDAVPWELLLLVGLAFVGVSVGVGVLIGALFVK